MLTTENLEYIDPVQCCGRAAGADIITPHRLFLTTCQSGPMSVKLRRSQIFRDSKLSPGDIPVYTGGPKWYWNSNLGESS